MRFCTRYPVLYCFLGITFALSAMERTAISEDVSALVPAFGRDPLGQNVGTVLNLKIWRTLRKTKTSLSAIVSWSTEPLPDSSYEYVETLARRVGLQLVLWGSIVRYGDGVLAQPLLSILLDEHGDGTDAVSWTVSIKDPAIPPLTVTIPRLRYALPAVILGNDLLQLYPTPASVKIYRGGQNTPPLVQSLGPPIGELGDDYKALLNEGDFTKVQTGRGKQGWIYLPKLDGDNEVVNFVGGLICLLRRDYRGAIELLDRVSASDTTINLRVDSFLLQALAAAKLHRDPGSLIDAAEKLNPYLQTTAKFKMVYLAYLSQLGSGRKRQSAASALKRQISETGYMFAEDDPWLPRANAFLKALDR
jgi:hypothetical protein